MKKFENLHPITLVIFFLSVLFQTMFFMDIICSIIFWTVGLIYSYVLEKRFSIKKIGFSIICVVIVAIANMLVSHSGDNIIIFINGKPITYEAMEYGIVTGIMIAGAFLWFLCMDKVIKGEKIYCIFKRTPKLALIISMILRLVPRYLRKYNSVKLVQKDNESPIAISSGVFTYAIENSMQTAAVMEMRGFTKAKIIYSGYRMKKEDLILIIINLLLVSAVVFFSRYRVGFAIIVALIPFIYRGKEAFKLWIYNLRK